jgi:hypothetical protein
MRTFSPEMIRALTSILIIFIGGAIGIIVLVMKSATAAFGFKVIQKSEHVRHSQI